MDMVTPKRQRKQGSNWSVDDIDFEGIEHSAVARDQDLMYLLVAASFVEISSDLYTHNLVQYFHGDREIEDWLLNTWEPEELQHGAALRRYVTGAWPTFDWDSAYRDFYSDYSRFCGIEQLGPTRALELAARCVVETGTASMYTLLGQLTDEPVLQKLTEHIRRDEIRHYSHFYRYFVRYQLTRPATRLAVLRTLWARINEVDGEDAYCAFKHVFRYAAPEQTFDERSYRAFRQRLLGRARELYPVHMASKMLLKPLALGPRVQRTALPLVVAGARLLMRH